MRIKRSMNKWLYTAITVGFFAACSASNGGSGFDDDDGTGGTAQGGGDTGGDFTNVGGGVNVKTGTLSGRVTAPEGTVPIAGALVYATQAVPAEFPQQVFCNTCVELETSEPFTETGVDGTFSLDVPVGSWQLVVQKGAFRRVRPIEVTEGMITVPADDTRFPSMRDPANGDEIPRIGVLQGIYDPIDEILQQFGVQTLEVRNDHQSVLDNYTELQKYHIVFLPCRSEFSISPGAQTENLRNYVQSGGKVYATDLSSFAIDTAFQQEGAIDFSGFAEPWTPVFESELDAWLQGQNVVINSYGNTLATNINNVANYTAPDEDGMMTQLVPKVWVDGQTSSATVPKTVSFQYGCGEVLFSTYHTEEFNSGTDFTAEELVLFHIILEVAACVGEVGVPN